MKQLILAAALAIGIASTGGVSASGIPVVDVAALANNTASQAANIAKYVQMIQQYKTQIDQMKTQYEALTGSRGLGMIAQDPKLRDYLPDGWQEVYDGVTEGGYKGLSGPAKRIIAANSSYDMCENKEPGITRNLCERAASKAAQDKAFAVEAFDSAKDRWTQIEQLMQEIDSTSDPKAIAELQARINSEQAAIQNEQTKLQMFAMIAQAEDRLIEQSQRERAAQHFNGMQFAKPETL